MRIDFHGRFVFISRLSGRSPGSDELISSFVGNPMIIGAKVKVKFRLVVARDLCFGEAPELIVPGVCGDGFHFVTGQVSVPC